MGVMGIVFGVLFILVGLWMKRSAQRADQADPPPPGEESDATS